MSWFNILKNQVAATSEGMFELDFSEPMVVEEEETCKKKLRALYNRLKNFSPPAGFKKKTIRPYNSDFRYRFLTDNYRPSGEQIRVSGKDLLDEVPEEICCKAIELFKRAAYDDDAYDNGKETGYEIYVEKNLAYPFEGQQPSSDAVYMIEINIPAGKVLYSAQIDYRILGSADEDIIKEKLASIAEPLFNL